MASPERFYATGYVGTIRKSPVKLMGCAAGEVLFADVLLLPNGMSKVGDVV